MRRRELLGLAGTASLFTPFMKLTARAQPASPPITLLSAPLDLKGEWGGAPPEAVLRVLARIREVALSGVRLLSDQQPERLRVEDHSSGPPAIWLHADAPTTAWVIVDIGPADWCKLAYQFGHEFGHVLCNSWGSKAQPGPPSQWLEEAVVEAFSIRSLGLLAASWEKNPPFGGDAPFAQAIRDYRENLVEDYRKTGGPEGPAVLVVLPELEKDRQCVEDMGAANRWPARTRVPVEQYLSLWEKSCAELGASGHLPARLRTLLRLGELGAGSR